jgi:hypothetical protein
MIYTLLKDLHFWDIITINIRMQQVQMVSDFIVRLDMRKHTFHHRIAGTGV